MSTRHLLADDDLTAAEQRRVLDLADRLKVERHAEQPLAGPRSVAIIFDKPTLRTQLSFTTGVAELGGYPMVVDGNLAQIGARESVADVARVVGRQVSAIVWRTHGQDRLEEMAAHVDVPVVNALTDEYHPCQLLADLMTIREHKGETAGLTLAYLGDGGNNMAHSYLLAGALAGMHVRIGTPRAHQPSARVVARAEGIATEQGGSITITDDPAAAAADADAVATDTWVSMGMEAEKGERTGGTSPFAPYAVTRELLTHAAQDAVVLHCLPAYRGLEIEAEVIDGDRSVVWQEAENRLHVQKALLAFLLAESS